MTPWSGYFIKNNENDSVEISIKPIYYSTSLSKNDNVKTRQASSPQEGEWKIYIDNIIQFGCLQNANDEWDENDLSEPPPAPISVETRQHTINNESSNINDGVSVQNNISIRFPHPEWRECKANYVRDFRPIGKNGYIWNMNFRRDEACLVCTDLKLNFDLIGNFPKEFDIILYDLERGTEIEPLNKNDGQINYDIKFGIDRIQKNLRIIVGTKEYVGNESRKTEHETRKYALYQNYPNPFNPSTFISYQLPVNSYVSLKIYNTLGQEVRTLVDEYKQTGSYSIEWKPENIPSGVYFYRLQIEKFSEMKKMLYIR
jgi:hypothetical protein